jgi:hypothetical protein
LTDALSFARSRKAGLENEPRILADLANAYRLNGDNVRTLTTAVEAINIATERHARVPECLARFVRATSLLSSSNKDQNVEGAEELRRAEALMHETGALIFRSFVNAADAEDPGTPKTSIKAG